MKNTAGSLAPITRALHLKLVVVFFYCTGKKKGHSLKSCSLIITEPNNRVMLHN